MDNDPQSISALLCSLFFIYLIYDSDLAKVGTVAVELSVHMQRSLATSKLRIN